MHLCKIHYSLENQKKKKPQKIKEAIILKGGVQKTGALILGEQRNRDTTVHYKLCLYEERTVTPVTVKAKETSLPTPKQVNLRCESI